MDVMPLTESSTPVIIIVWKRERKECGSLCMRYENNCQSTQTEVSRKELLETEINQGR